MDEADGADVGIRQMMSTLVPWEVQEDQNRSRSHHHGRGNRYVRFVGIACLIDMESFRVRVQAGRCFSLDDGIGSVLPRFLAEACILFCSLDLY